MMMAPPVNQKLLDPDASIVLIGCRGAGKRSLGFIGALHLRRRLITEDHFFKQETGLSKGSFLAQYGKDVFARKSVELLKQMLDRFRKKCIIECGLTSLKALAQTALKDYCATNPVIYIHREKEEMMRILDSKDANQLLEADRTHRKCSNFEYFNLYDAETRGTGAENGSADGRESSEIQQSRMHNAKRDFTIYLDLLLGQAWKRVWLESPFAVNAIPPHFRAHSYALRLRLSYLMDMSLPWEDFEACADCVELIIDRHPDELHNLIASQVALIRRHLSVPIIFYVDNGPRNVRRHLFQNDRDIYDTEILELGLRLNVEYVCLDMQRSPVMVERILSQKGRSKIIASYWYKGVKAKAWADDVLVEDYRRAQALGSDVVRMVRFSSGDSTSMMLEEFRVKIDKLFTDSKPPLVALEYSVLGLRTPVQSNILCPVKHRRTLEGQDELAAFVHYRFAFEQLFRQLSLDPLRFYTIGSNVSWSLNPALHQAAYDFSGMPHTYQATDCSTSDELKSICLDAHFGGALLAAPFKVAIMSHLKITGHHASAIGAANVLLPLRGQSSLIIDHANARNKAGATSDFYGDNTDWSSIYSCFKRAISPRNYVQPSKTTGVVIGAGGMARSAVYALIKLGCRNIFIFNRTVQNAEKVATHFNEWIGAQGPAAAVHGITTIKGASRQGRICHVLHSITQPWPAGFQPPTLIVSCVPVNSVDGNQPADFEMPKQWLGSTTGGVVIEMAYEPLITPLVAQMQVLRDTVSPSWTVVDGLEVLSEMAIEAFELMTGRMAPKRLMKEVCRKTWEEHRREDMSTDL